MIVPLSTAGIKDAIKRLEFFKDNIKIANEEIVSNLVDIGYDTASQINATAPQSGVEKSQVVKGITENRTKGYVALTGPSAVYDEFGTGEEGAANPHPMKNNTSRPLNPYNSGPYVSTHINSQGRHYWFYSPMAGKNEYYDAKTGYSEGIPSGKQIYNATKEVRARKDDVIKKQLNDAIRIINK